METAPIPEGFRATLRLLAKLTLRPGEITPRDIDAVRAAGVSDDATRDAIHVCALFNVIDRCADALDFEVPEDYPGEQLLNRGYLGIIGEG